MDVVETFRKAIATESDALALLCARLDGSVKAPIELLQNTNGRIAIFGMGKCGHIGQKMAATFVSTGTPAIFVHPAEALHGDIGHVASGDVALVLSYSGETDEILALLPALKRLALPVVAITGRPGSSLARASDATIDVAVDREADLLDMAPTASTTAMLAVGDALAVVLMQLRDFDPAQYAALHPGGSIGQRLLCRVPDLMHTGDAMPVVQESVTLREAILEMTSKRFGTTFLVDAEGALSGIITDGDLRRLLGKDDHPLDHPATEIMTRNPKRIESDLMAVDALRLMEDSLITMLAVVDEAGAPIGALHIHDLIRAGIS